MASSGSCRYGATDPRRFRRCAFAVLSRRAFSLKARVQVWSRVYRRDPLSLDPNRVEQLPGDAVSLLRYRRAPVRRQVPQVAQQSLRCLRAD